MVTVARHEIDRATFRRILDEEPEALQEILNEPTYYPLGFSSAYHTAMERASRLSVADPDGDELCLAIQIAAIDLVALFTLAGTEKGISVAVRAEDGSLVDLPGTGVTSESDAETWLRAFYLNLIVRDNDGLDVLAEIPTSLLQSSSTIMPEYIHALVSLFQAYWRQEGDLSPRLKTAVDSTSPDGMDADVADYVLHIIVPIINLFYQFLLTDVDAFNDALVDALESHRTYWERDDETRDNENGFLAIGPLAMACMAYDGDMPIRVESEYIPRRFVAGECASLTLASDPS